MLAKEGWALWKIQFLGRWGSATVVSYVEEAMAEVTANWHKPGEGAPAQQLDIGVKGGAPNLAERLDQLEEKLREVQQTRNEESRETAELRTQLEEMSARSTPGAIVTGLDCVHAVAEGVLEWPAMYWSTVCGWRFGNSSTAAIFRHGRADRVNKPRCAKCFRGVPSTHQ